MKIDRYIAYISSYTHGQSKGITIYDVDVKKGRLTERSEVEINNPSYMVKSNSGKFLYSLCDEGLTAYHIMENGDLSFINTGSIKGMRSRYLTIDSEDKYLFCAGYYDGKATVMKIRKDGGIGEIADEIYHKGLGSVAERNFRPHVSCVTITLDEKFVVACDPGIDQVKIYSFDKETGKLGLVDVLRCEIESAPRTMIFSPDGKFAYLICELKNYIGVYEYKYNESLPEFNLIENVSTLANKFSRTNAAVAMKMTEDGKHLFCINAGDNSVVMYKRDGETGRLTTLSVLPISGEYPKEMVIFPDGNHLISLNHESGEITFFTIDYKKGIIVMNGSPIPIETANCGIMVKLS
ncbi:MAG: lactonase family protein [Clostridiales bacterium]|nr:lactonase family protein [Clostridiales bacterium]